MYEVIIYDSVFGRTKVIDKADFMNEDCAWAYYDLKIKEKNEDLPSKAKLKVEFKYTGNGHIISHPD